MTTPDRLVASPGSGPLAVPGKVRTHHLDRLAVVYVRQSTARQVMENRESTDRQYQLADRAVALGWASDRVRVIDEDLGRSGRSAVDRAGFQKLLVEVGLGHVGVILGSETSRLARSCKDWYQLLELAAVFGVLIADYDGLYDPGQYADRMMLGLSGMMSEAELHVMRNRLDQGKRNKAARGELFSIAPIGYVRRPNGEMALDPDEQVQEVVRRIFDTFAVRGSVHQVRVEFLRLGIRLPIRIRGGPDQGRIEWREPGRGTMYHVIRHPIYAGAYCYGRSRSDPRRKISGRRHTGRVRVPAEEWAVLRRDIVPAYITWDQFQANQARLRENRATAGTRGTPRTGIALLGGVVACGRCGWRMGVRYHSSSQSPRYVCARNDIVLPGQSRCPTVSARVIDAAVERQVLAALAPATVDLSLAAAEQVGREVDGLERHWQLQLERARFQTGRARRQFDATEPENRLVARELERQWEAAIRAEQQLAEEYARFRQEQAAPLTAADRERIAALSRDIPGIWVAAGPSERKAILRHLVDRIEVHATAESEEARLTLRWVGGSSNEVDLVRPVMRYEGLHDFPRLRDRIRELLADGVRSGLIADRLNAEGYRSPRGNHRFTADRIRQIVCRQGLRPRRSNLPTDAPRLDPDEAWMTDLADELTIPIPTLTAWCRKGWVHARRLDAPDPRWAVWANEAEKNRMRQLSAGRKGGLRYPYPIELRTPGKRPDR